MISEKDSSYISTFQLKYRIVMHSGCGGLIVEVCMNTGGLWESEVCTNTGGLWKSEVCTNTEDVSGRLWTSEVGMNTNL